LLSNSPIARPSGCSGFIETDGIETRLRCRHPHPKRGELHAQDRQFQILDGFRLSVIEDGLLPFLFEHFTHHCMSAPGYENVDPADMVRVFSAIALFDSQRKKCGTEPRG
jgi:hypothetical protein